MVLFCGDNNIANPASINVAAAAAATSTGEVVEVEKDADADASASASATAHETANGGVSGAEAAMTSAAAVKQSRVSRNTTRQAGVDFKCSVSGCKLGKNPTPKDTCAANVLEGKTKCLREVHTPCFEHLVVVRSKGKIPPADPEGDLAGKVFCTLGCYRAYMKAHTPGSGWGNDGKDGPNDPNCSENLLVKHFLSSERHYGEFRRPPNGQTKIDICNRWATFINGFGVQKKRSGKDIQNKIETIEKQMKLAYDWSNTQTGIGVKDGTLFGDFDECIKEHCKFYFDLIPVFIQRAGMKPLATTDDILNRLDGSTDNDEESGSSDIDSDDGVVLVLSSDEEDDAQQNKESKSQENDDDDVVDFGNNEKVGFSSSDEDDGGAGAQQKERSHKGDGSGSSSAQRKEGSKSNKKQTKKTKKKNRKDSKKSGGRNKTPTFTRKKGKKGSILDEQLEGLLSLKLEEMKYKKRKHEREEEQNKRRKLEDYDLTDAEQWIEFAARFEAIKETVGGDPVRAALQFPRFAETTLLTADEKKEFHNQQGF